MIKARIFSDLISGRWDNDHLRHVVRRRDRSPVVFRLATKVDGLWTVRADTTSNCIHFPLFDESRRNCEGEGVQCAVCEEEKGHERQHLFTSLIEPSERS